VDRFYRDTIDGLAGRQEILSKYKKPFERNRDSMFTFLGEDEIPWNNNAAERALRHLASSARFRGISRSKEPGDTCGYLQLLRHVGFKISRF
jgi:hypothetical protein